MGHSISNSFCLMASNIAMYSSHCTRSCTCIPCNSLHWWYYSHQSLWPYGKHLQVNGWHLKGCKMLLDYIGKAENPTTNLQRWRCYLYKCNKCKAASWEKINKQTNKKQCFSSSSSWFSSNTICSHACQHDIHFWCGYSFFGIR